MMLLNQYKILLYVVECKAVILIFVSNINSYKCYTCYRWHFILFLSVNYFLDYTILKVEFLSKKSKFDSSFFQTCFNFSVKISRHYCAKNLDFFYPKLYLRYFPVENSKLFLFLTFKFKIFCQIELVAMKLFWTKKEDFEQRINKTFQMQRCHQIVQMSVL